MHVLTWSEHTQHGKAGWFPSVYDRFTLVNFCFVLFFFAKNVKYHFYYHIISQCTKQDVRQGCVLFTMLFLLSSKHKMKSIENMPRIVICGQNINNLHYADATTLTVESQKELHKNY